MQGRAGAHPDDVALVVVDVQRDFLPGGALGIPGGEAVVPVLARLIPRYRTVVFSRDWHPEGHVSFSERPRYAHLSWPPHAVRGTPGAEFHPDLPVPEGAWIVSKATERDREQMSAFDGTGLAERLRARGVRSLHVGGLATDWCVKQTALDAVREGFDVTVVEDAVRGVDAPPGAARAAEGEMRAAGVRFVPSRTLLARVRDREADSDARATP
ncbi:isochorismatase family protein [Myxococcota bacterium]|nr:isochorismatase family protein [Myxococcota bacterium]